MIGERLARSEDADFDALSVRFGEGAAPSAGAGVADAARVGDGCEEAGMAGRMEVDEVSCFVLGDVEDVGVVSASCEGEIGDSTSLRMGRLLM